MERQYSGSEPVSSADECRWLSQLSRDNTLLRRGAALFLQLTISSALLSLPPGCLVPEP